MQKMRITFLAQRVPARARVREVQHNIELTALVIENYKVGIELPLQEIPLGFPPLPKFQVASTIFRQVGALISPTHLALIRVGTFSLKR